MEHDDDNDDNDDLTHFVVAYRLDGDTEIQYFPVWAEHAEDAVYKCCDKNPEAEWAQAYAPVPKE